jgi:membrane associated rhomboid family serine protease
MLQNLFKNMGPITKNLLIINVLFFIATLVFESRGIDFTKILGMHYPSSQYFEPYQIVTHFFMHGGFQHLLLNMLGLLFLGPQLERFWGAEKFLIFYLVSAFGAILINYGVQGLALFIATGEFFPDLIITQINYSTGMVNYETELLAGVNVAVSTYVPSLVGASGAIFGLIAAYGVLFPNTEFRLYFLIPVKAKWVAIGSAVYAVYSGVSPIMDDNTAHFAHLGGMIFGFILIKIWQKSRNEFY